MADRIGPMLVLAACILAGCSDEGDEPEPMAQVDGPGQVRALVPFTASGELLAGAGSTSPATPQGCDTLQQEGVDVNRHPWEVPGTLDGVPADVQQLTVTMTIASATLLDADIYLEAPDGEVLGSSVAFNPMTGPSETVTAGGPLDPGTYVVVIRACTGSGSYELSGDAEMLTRVPPAPSSDGTTSS